MTPETLSAAAPTHPNALAVVGAAFARGHKPDPDLSLPEWSEKYARVPSEDGPYPGRYQNARTPYWIRVGKAMSPNSPAQRIAVRKGAQLGFTRLIVNALCMIIDVAPSSILYASATLDLLRATIDQKIDPTFRDVERVRRKLPPPEKRTKSNRVFSRPFPGGLIRFVTAGAAAALRATTVRYVFIDEIDACGQDVDGEGDPVKLAEARTKTYGERRKIIYGGTPTIAELSKIDALIEQSTDERYLVPCPHCGKLQELVFSPELSDGGFDCKGRLVWNVDDQKRLVPGSVAYQCGKCKQRIPESKKAWMLAEALEHGRDGWHAAGDPQASVLGFSINSLYAWPGSQSWTDIVREYLEARTSRFDPDDPEKPDRLRSFFNTVLGISWKEANQAPPYQQIHARREAYTIGVVPPGPAAVLTAGVDVQADRFEYEIVAWGPHDESWSVAYDVIPGGPEDVNAWRELERRLLHEHVPFAGGGRAPVHQVAVDASYASNIVYQWAATQRRERVMVVRGKDQLETPVGIPKPAEIDFRGRRVKSGALWWPVGVSVLKGELYAFLAKEPGKKGESVPGLCHFPDYELRHFQGLTAEAQVVKKDRFGRRKYHWQVFFERNEPLDCRVYARAAALRFGVNRFTDAEWDWWRKALENPMLLAPEPPKLRVTSAGGDD